jgi:hypothetical protein
MPLATLTSCPWKVLVLDKVNVGQWLSYQDRNQATMVFCSKAPLSCPCWKPPFVQRQATDGTTHHSWGGIKLMLCQDRVQGVWAGEIAYRYVGTGGPDANECRGGRPKR